MAKETKLLPFLPLVLISCLEPFSNEDLVFLKSLPDPAVIKVDVPRDEVEAGQGLSAAEGEQALFYGQALEISGFFNGILGGILEFVGALSKEPPSLRQDDLRAWGPIQEQGIELQLLVNRKQSDAPIRTVSTATAVLVDHYFEYLLQARRIGASEADWQVLLAGLFAPLPQGDHGLGYLGVDLDRAQMLNPNSQGAGKLLVAFDSRDDQVLIELGIDLPTAEDEDGPDPDAIYRFSKTKAGEVAFDFGAIKDIHEGDPTQPRREIFVIRARWLADHRGRADVFLTGGELPVVVQANECWDRNFQRVYFAANPEIPAWGGTIGSNLDCALEHQNPIE